MGFISRKIDIQLLIPVLILVGISLTALFSIPGVYFRNQLIFFVLSIGLFFFFSSVDFSFFQTLGKPLYLIALIGLFVLIFLGAQARGASRWLDVFGIRLQFSEIFKPFLAIALASFLAKREKNAWTIGLLLVYLLPLVFLIYKQPDLGSALLYMLSVLVTLLLLGFPAWLFTTLAGSVIVLIPLLFRFLHGYQKQRLLTFFHLTNDPLGSSYNAIQALIAIGSGLFFGKGFGQGTQSGLRFLPERHTDFIFATLSEDLGFIGGVVVIAAISYLLYRIYRIAMESEEQAEKVFAIAAFSLFFVQAFVNIGMNMGILPIVGVPLPFVSYGGSSLLSSSIFLGILSRFKYNNRSSVTLEIR